MSALLSSCRAAHLTLKGAFFLSRALERSILLGFLGRCFAFVERSFASSALRRAALHLPRLYPERLFCALDRLNTALPGISVSPAVLFALAYLLFLSAGDLSMVSFSLVLLFLLCFGAAFSMSSRIKVRRLIFEESVLRLGIALLLLSLLALCLDLYRAYTLPVLDPAARAKLSVPYTYLATFLVPGGVLIAALLGGRYAAGGLSLREVRMYTFALTLAVVFLVSLLGYRTQTVVSLLAFATVLHRYRVIGRAELFLGVAGVLLAVVLLGYYRTSALGSEASVLQVLTGRMAMTIMLYDYTVNALYQKGLLLLGYYRGEVALATFSSFLDFVPGYSLGPRTIVAMSFGVSGVSLTSTLLGTVVLDLGIAGVVLFAAALGSVLGSVYALSNHGSTLGTALFATCFAYLIAGIETGLVDFSVFVLYGFAAFVALASAAGEG